MKSVIVFYMKIGAVAVAIAVFIYGLYLSELKKFAEKVIPLIGG